MDRGIVINELEAIFFSMLQPDVVDDIDYILPLVAVNFIHQ